MGAHWPMPAASMAAILISLFAVTTGWHHCRRILGGALPAAAVMLPFAAAIPWLRAAPGLQAPLALAAVFLVLGGWLRMRAFGGGAKTALAAAIAAVLVRPDIIALPFIAIIADGLLFRDRRRIGARAAAAVILVAAAILSAMLWRMTPSPAAATAWLLDSIKEGSAWDSGVWVFAGADEHLAILAGAAGLKFFWPFLPPLVPLALAFRREPWLAPLLLWAAAITALTLVQAPAPNIHSCLPMTAALTVGLGVPAAAALQRMFRNGAAAKPRLSDPARAEVQSPRAR